MTIKTDAKRAKFGQNMEDLGNQGQRAVGNVIAIFSNLSAQKAAMQDDTDTFTPEDIAEIDAVRFTFADQIAAAINAGDTDLKNRIVTSITE